LRFSYYVMPSVLGEPPKNPYQIMYYYTSIFPSLCCLVWEHPLKVIQKVQAIFRNCVGADLLHRLGRLARKISTREGCVVSTRDVPPRLSDPTSLGRYVKTLSSQVVRGVMLSSPNASLPPHCEPGNGGGYRQGIVLSVKAIPINGGYGYEIRNWGIIMGADQISHEQ
jgi:hypothetical protein